MTRREFNDYMYLGVLLSYDSYYDKDDEIRFEEVAKKIDSLPKNIFEVMLADFRFWDWADHLYSIAQFKDVPPFEFAKEVEEELPF